MECAAVVVAGIDDFRLAVVAGTFAGSTSMTMSPVPLHEHTNGLRLRPK